MERKLGSLRLISGRQRAAAIMGSPLGKMKYEIEKSYENRDSFLNPDFKISG
jgi:hypothetical protein